MINYDCRSVSIFHGISTPPEAKAFKERITYLFCTSSPSCVTLLTSLPLLLLSTIFLNFKRYILSQDDEVLNEQLDQFTKSYPTSDDADVRHLAAIVCVPAQELCVSPFALRVAALAAQEGIIAVHHELRKWTQVC